MEAAVRQADPLAERHAVRVDGEEVVVFAVAQDARVVDARHDAAAADGRAMRSSSWSPAASGPVLRRFDEPPMAESAAAVGDEWSRSAAGQRTAGFILIFDWACGGGCGIGRATRCGCRESVGRRAGKVNRALGRPQLAVDVRVLPDAVLEIRHLRLEPRPARRDSRSIASPPPRRTLVPVQAEQRKEKGEEKKTM